MIYDVIIVGGGIAGLTAAAFLTKAGYTTLLCEKENTCGGLINSFERDGFVFDGGIRALENSGVLFPMLKQLGLEMEFVKNKISVGIEDRVIRIDTQESLQNYQDLLNQFFPDNLSEIAAITSRIREIMHYLDVQYAIDNPIFLDFRGDRGYLIKVILPWMFKYLLTFPKIRKLYKPVEVYLKGYTQDQSLLDIITQHFFRATPTFFALSYISLYLDYYYPLGGTGKFIEKIVEYIDSHQGKISTNTKILAVDPDNQRIFDIHGNSYGYRRLIWAADQKTLYRSIDPEKIADKNTRNTVLERRTYISDKPGNDSVFTLYLALDLDKSYFGNKNSEHFFYTPSRMGQSLTGSIPLSGNRETIEKWLERFFSLTTYEITCPIMRDSNLAPAGKTGLIVSVLFDYKLTKTIQDMGWYELFKSFSELCMIDTLNGSIYPGIKEAILLQFSSTPLSIAKVTGNTEGAITGWSFTSNPMPAENRLPKILEAIKTPVPGILQAGQWTFSPSGFPISILTGKMAADRVIKDLVVHKKAV